MTGQQSTTQRTLASTAGEPGGSAMAA